MAPGIIPLPGSEAGPCQEACTHKDCSNGRAIAESVCAFCEKEIGYEAEFYQDEEKRYLHAKCLEEDIERR